jgi:hypothetical protein
MNELFHPTPLQMRKLKYDKKVNAPKGRNKKAF